jgi:hypothetical protein
MSEQGVRRVRFTSTDDWGDTGRIGRLYTTGPVTHTDVYCRRLTEPQEIG